MMAAIGQLFYKQKIPGSIQGYSPGRDYLAAEWLLSHIPQGTLMSAMFYAGSGMLPAPPARALNPTASIRMKNNDSAGSGKRVARSKKGRIKHLP